RGRLPGASALGCPGFVSSVCRRVPSGTPVSPIITDGSQAPLGVDDQTLPCRSTTFTHVVSGIPADEPPPEGIGTLPPNSPGRLSIEACSGSISFRRSLAYSFDSSTCSGISENFGSP